MGGGSLLLPPPQSLFQEHLKWLCGVRLDLARKSFLLPFLPGAGLGDQGVNLRYRRGAALGLRSDDSCLCLEKGDATIHLEEDTDFFGAVAWATKMGRT